MLYEAEQRLWSKMGTEKWKLPKEHMLHKNYNRSSSFRYDPNQFSTIHRKRSKPHKLQKVKQSQNWDEPLIERNRDPHSGEDAYILEAHVPRNDWYAMDVSLLPKNVKV